MESILVDELKLYRGDDFKVNELLTLHTPTLGEICDYGEMAYFSMIHSFTGTPADLMWQLDDIGIDYTAISDWELFYQVLYHQFRPEVTGILFGDFDFSSLKPYIHQDSGEVCLAGLGSLEEEVIIDAYTYRLLTEYVRKLHGLAKNEKRPANETTKQILIEDARDAYLMNQKKEPRSVLKNLISGMINSEGFKFNYQTVWDMNIHAFLDSVERISKIKNATLLLQSGYSGFGIDLKKIKSKQLDWLGEL